MVKSRFERKVLVSSDEEDEEKFSADETGINDNLDPKISSDDMKRFIVFCIASKQLFASSPTSEAAIDFSLSSNFLVFEAKAKAFRRLPLRQRPQQTL